MPIEFHCQSCKNLLRVPDESAGQMAKCPSCGAVTLVPAAPTGTADDDELQLAPLPPSSTPAGGTSGGVPTGGANVPGGEGFAPPSGPERPQDYNPYASPSYESEAAYQRSLGIGEGRDGPPWEREGPSVSSFIATVKEMYQGPSILFRHMRREGGLGAPLGFAIAGGWIGTVFSMLYQLVQQSLMANMARGPGQLPGNQGTMLFGNIGGLVCFGVTAPLWIALAIFISAGLTHLCLMMVGGANRAFETTFRVIAYAYGAASLLEVVPFCGGLIAGIVLIVWEIFGLIEAHETSGGKATAGVLLPLVVCCTLCVAPIIALAVVSAAISVR